MVVVVVGVVGVVGVVFRATVVVVATNCIDVTGARVVAGIVTASVGAGFVLGVTVVVLSMICVEVESLFPPPTRVTRPMTAMSTRPVVVPMSTFRRLELFC